MLLCLFPFVTIFAARKTSRKEVRKNTSEEANTEPSEPKEAQENIKNQTSKQADRQASEHNMQGRKQASKDGSKQGRKKARKEGRREGGTEGRKEGRKGEQNSMLSDVASRSSVVLLVGRGAAPSPPTRPILLCVAEHRRREDINPLRGRNTTTASYLLGIIEQAVIPTHCASRHRK